MDAEKHDLPQCDRISRNEGEAAEGVDTGMETGTSLISRLNGGGADGIGGDGKEPAGSE